MWDQPGGLANRSGAGDLDVIIYSARKWARLALAGNPTVFGHGMLTAGFVARCITDFVGIDNVRRYKVRFATRVWPGDTITCQGRVTKRYEADGEGRIDGEVAAVNQKGEVAVSGTFTAALPRRG